MAWTAAGSAVGAAAGGGASHRGRACGRVEAACDAEGLSADGRAYWRGGAVWSTSSVQAVQQDAARLIESV